MKYKTDHYREKCACPANPSSFPFLQCLGKILPAETCLVLILTALAARVLPAQSLGPAIHRAPKPITFITPETAQTFTTPTVPVQVHIAGGMNPESFKIKINGKNVTNQFTASGACSPESCDESASLSLADGIRVGWNRLIVSANSDRGAVDSAQARFFYNDGLLGDATNASQPPHDVHIAVQPDGSVKLDYQPNVVGGSTTFPVNCPSNAWSVLVIDRASLTQANLGTLGLPNQACFPSQNGASVVNYVERLPFNTIVVIKGPENLPLGSVDMSSIGGTNFAATGAPSASSYSIIGYGQSAPGLAYESYTTNGDPPSGIEGVLEDVCCSSTNTDIWTSFYAFRPADQPGFTVSYPNNVAQIEIKYNNDNDFPLGLGNAPPPNRAIPSGLDLDTVTSAGNMPGIWLTIFSRQTLQLAGWQIFTPTTQDTQNNHSTVYQNLASAIKQLYGSDGSGLTSKDALIFITITQPQNFPIPEHQDYGVIGDVSRAIQSLGGSASDFWQAVSTGQHYALVATTTDNVPSSKQYSTEVDSHQFESGLLHGLLPRNHQMLYTPSQVIPITTNLAQNGDYLWERDILPQISGTRPVPWPYTGDSGHLAAYAWLSQLILKKDLTGGSDPAKFSFTPCTQTDTTCDIRFYYTGEQAPKIANGLDPAPNCKDSANGTCDDYSNDPIFTAYQNGGGEAKLEFSLQALQDIQTQLSLERAYLGNVEQLNSYLQSVYTSNNSNVALVLSNTASKLKNALINALPEAPTPPGVDKLALTADILSDVAGAASIVSGGGTLAGSNPISGAAGIFSGILSTAASIVNTVDAAHPTPPPTDPYVVELSDLETTTDGKASQIAINFSSDLQASTADFFNSVYSDWYRLQSVGLMTINTAPSNAWYIATTNGPTATAYLTSMAASAKNQFYMAILPQQFVLDTYPGMADGYNAQSTNSLLQTCYGTSSPPDFTYDNPTPSVYPDYNWIYTGGDNNTPPLDSLLNGAYSPQNPQPDYSRPGRDVYVIRTNPNSQGHWGFWTDDIGNDLMSQPVANQNYDIGETPLNLNQNWFFESSILPKIYLGCPAGGGPNNF